METDPKGASTSSSGGSKPMSPEVLAGVRQLDVDPSNSRFMMLVDDLIRPESLPRGWTAKFDAEKGKWVYTDKHEQTHDKHPVYDYYIGAMFMDKGGYAKLKQLAVERPPTAEEVKQMGMYLNIKEGEDPYLWQVAEMALCAPLPPQWEETVEGPPDAPVVKFMNKETGASMEEHPLDNYFRELLRRRRRELLRRKKAALKAVQGLVRMGVGRKGGLFANLLAQKKAEGDAAAAGQAPDSAEQEEDELDSMSPAVRSSLTKAWQGLVGSAVNMVKSLQAANWDASASSSSTSSAAGTAAEGSAGADPEAAAQGRLQLLHDRLITALDPAAAGSSKAAAALQSIEQLAAQATAAGNDPEKIADVLAGQGLVITIGGAESGFSSRSSRSRNLGDQGTAGPRLQQDRSRSPAIERVVTPASLEDAVDAAGDADAHLQVLPRRPSFSHAQPLPELPGEKTRRKSLLADKISFLEVSTPSPEPGRASSPANHLADMFKTHGLSTTPNSNSGAYANLGPYSSTGGAAEWSLSGGAPTPAGAAAARNIRTNAALARDAESAKNDSAEGLATAAAATAGSDVSDVGGTFRQSALGPDLVAKMLKGAASRDHKPQDPNGQPSQPDGVQAGNGQHNAVTSAATEPKPQEQQQQGLGAGGRLGFFLGIADLPPSAEAALQHLSALQGVIEEAIAVIRSWQQQQLIILLLQQRLAAAAARAEADDARLSEVLAELDHITQQQQSSTAATTTAEYQKLQEQSDRLTQELEAARADQTQSQQSRDVLQQALDAALAAAAAAKAQQQQLEEQLAAVQQRLQQEQDVRKEQQQDLDNTKAELDKLRAEHTRLQEATGSEVAATAAQLSQLQSDHAKLQAEHTKLQGTLSQGQAAAAAAGGQQQQLAQQLQQAQQELEALRQSHAQLQVRFNQQGQELTDAQTRYVTLQGDHKTQGDALEQAREQLQRLQQQSEQAGGELGNSRQEVMRLQTELDAAQQQRQQLEQHQQQLQQDKQQLEQQWQQLQDQISGQGGDLSNVQQQLSQLQKQLADSQHQKQELEQQRQQLEQQKLQLQDRVNDQGTELSNVAQALASTQQQLTETTQQLQQSQQQLQEGQKHQQQLQQELQQTQQKLAQVSQQLQQSQQEQQQTQQLLQQTHQQLQQLQALNRKAQDDQTRLMDVNLKLMKELKDLKAAAEATEKQRLSKPSKVSQITAVDADQQHWTHARSVQTGEELDPRSKRDVGTPADLSLLSYFFREIKQKQRGGGGAIIGYDSENAREAAAVATSPSARSPGPGPLPGIQMEARRAASMPGGLARPNTTKPSITGGKKPPEPEVKEGNLDLRPVPWEVKSRVDRRRDREMKLESESGARGDHDRWDYAKDERDSEIAELKKRLADQEKRNKDAAAKAADDMRELATELQSAKHTAELLQTDNFTLRKENNSLRIAMQAVGMSVPSDVAPARTSALIRHSIAPRASLMPGGQGIANPGGTHHKEGGGPRTSVAVGRPRTTSSLTGSTQGNNAGGVRLSMAGSMPLPVNTNAWGSGFGGSSPRNPGVLAGGTLVSGSGSISPNRTRDGKTPDDVGLLSLSGGAGVHFLGTSTDGSGRSVSPSAARLGSLTGAGKAASSPRGPPGQQLVPTLRSGVVNTGQGM